jgi:hypothetical protein
LLISSEAEHLWIRPMTISLEHRQRGSSFNLHIVPIASRDLIKIKVIATELMTRASVAYMEQGSRFVPKADRTGE